MGVIANQLSIQFSSKEFVGCEFYEMNDDVDNKIFYLMKEGKYDQVISLGTKHLKDDNLWYCDGYFWTQRAKAFYSMGKCVPSLTAALHAIYVTPLEANKPEKEFYDFVSNSDICVTKY
jgi:hypothetical protein